MTLDYSDYPGLFKYYGTFLKEWVLTHKYFTLELLLDKIELGDIEDDDGPFFDNQEFWSKFI